MTKKILMCILVGVCLGLSYPPVSWIWLQPVALLIMLHISYSSPSWRSSVCYLFIIFLCFNIVGTYWLYMASAYGVLAIVANAFIMSMVWGVIYLIQKKFYKPFYQIIFISTLWVTYEYIIHWWDLAWPWLNFGNAWANFPQYIQFIAYTGYLGSSLWMMMVATTMYLAQIKKRSEMFIVGLCIFFIPMIWSYIQYHSASHPTDAETKRVLVIQPNINPYTRQKEDPAIYVKDLAMQIDTVLGFDTDYILLPENALNETIIERRVPYHILKEFGQWDEVSLIIGGIHRQQQKHTIQNKNDGDGEVNYYVSAFLFKDGQWMDIHHKRHLVPMVERIPFFNVVSFLGLSDFYDIKEGYSKGSKESSLKVDDVRITTLVCYDSIFPTWIRSLLTDEKGFIAVITNDGWWGNTSGHHQHYAYARLRAIEMGQWVVRSANNGTSGVISPTGKIEVKTIYDTKTSFFFDVPLLKPTTFYAQYGNWLFWIVFSLSSVGLIVLVLKMFMNPFKKQ